MDEAWEIPLALDGERLDRVLALSTGLSRQAVNALIDAGVVRVGRRAIDSRSRKVHTGDRVTVVGGIPRVEPVTPAADPAVEVPVVWADEAVIVVDKPAGLVVHPGAGHAGGTLVHGLLAKFPDLNQLGGDRPGIVHRLDKGTSGLLVVARTQVSFGVLTKQMAQRRVTRTYVALVVGTVDSDSGLIDAPLARSDVDPTAIRVQAGGRPARTTYSVEQRFVAQPATTLLRCGLETGRTHQIRVHLSSIGHPVVGDRRYGGPAWPGLGRPFLHAAHLAFDHPTTGELVEFSSPLSHDLQTVLATISHGR